MPERCARSASSACLEQRRSIRQCPLTLGAREMLPLNISDHRRMALISTLRRRQIGVIGDSMARQAFTTLTSRLRGQVHVIDPNSFRHWRYTLAIGRYHMADALEPWSLYTGRVDVLPHHLFGVPRDTTSEPAPQTARQWAMSHAQRGSSGAVTAEVSYSHAPCLADVLKGVRRLPSTVTSFFIFAPAFWHMLGQCRNSTHPWSDLPAPSVHWQAVLDEAAQRSNASFTLIIPPLERARTERTRNTRVWQELAHVALRKSFQAGGQFHAAGWRLFDFGALTRSIGPSMAPATATWQQGANSDAPTLAAFSNWHYVCQPTIADLWKTGGAAKVMHVAAHPDGGCDDVANTALWDELLLDHAYTRLDWRRSDRPASGFLANFRAKVMHALSQAR